PRKCAQAYEPAAHCGKLHAGGWSSRLGHGGPGPLPSPRDAKRRLAKARRGRATEPDLPERPRLKVAPALPLNAMNGRHAKWESSIVNFEERAFRDALSVFPTGVAV